MPCYGRIRGCCAGMMMLASMPSRSRTITSACGFPLVIVGPRLAVDRNSPSASRCCSSSSTFAPVLLRLSPDRRRCRVLDLDQAAFTFEGDDIERHRLNFNPCPFVIDCAELAIFGDGLLDYITDAFMTDLEPNLFLRSPIRLDFSPAAAADFHPASHLTINSPECRIPARSPPPFRYIHQVPL
jgi:hypothetical protein